MHAAIDFCFEHQEIAKGWQTSSNYLAVLSAKDENELKSLIQKLETRSICHTIFREPDLGNVITAVAIEPSDAQRKITSGFPLLLKEYGSFV